MASARLPKVRSSWEMPYTCQDGRGKGIPDAGEGPAQKAYRAHRPPLIPLQPHLFDLWLIGKLRQAITVDFISLNGALQTGKLEGRGVTFNESRCCYTLCLTGS